MLGQTNRAGTFRSDLLPSQTAQARFSSFQVATPTLSASFEGTGVVVTHHFRPRLSEILFSLHCLKLRQKIAKLLVLWRGMHGIFSHLNGLLQALLVHEHVDEAKKPLRDWKDKFHWRCEMLPRLQPRNCGRGASWPVRRPFWSKPCADRTPRELPDRKATVERSRASSPRTARRARR